MVRKTAGKFKKVISVFLALSTTFLSLTLSAPVAKAAALGGGFTVTVSDLQFILDQIQMSQSHAATLTAVISNNSGSTANNSTAALISGRTTSAPFTATITNLTSTANLVAGQVITATANNGSFGSGVVTVASILTPTSITVTSTSQLTNGRVRSITTAPTIDADGRILNVSPNMSVLAPGRDIQDVGSSAGTRNVIAANSANLVLASNLLPGGLRQVDGRNNNISQGIATWYGYGYITQAGRSAAGASDTKFPRMVPESFRVSTAPNNIYDYGVDGGDVTDRAPRYISNLISDQSQCNIAAYMASQQRQIDALAKSNQTPGLSAAQKLLTAQNSVRDAYLTSMGTAGSVCDPTHPGGLATAASNRDIEMQANSLLIPNTAPDAFKAPYNGNFVLFGQFFDHGLDLVGKSGTDHVVVPVLKSDPLYATCAPSYLRCTSVMSAGRTIFTRGGSAGSQTAGTNSTTPWIDQNQTYTSDPSHQIFLRQYRCKGLAGSELEPDTKCTSANPPVPTGILLDSYSTVAGGGASGNIATWADIKTQSLNKLGITLNDADVFNIPLVLSDEYGRFLPGPSGFPLLVSAANRSVNSGALVANPIVIEGNPAAVVNASDADSTGHEFLNDMAYFAQPSLAFATRGQKMVDRTNDCADGSANPGGAVGAGKYDCLSLDKHFITGDGRGNENIGLTAVHTVWHSEHNRLINQIKNVIIGAAVNDGNGLTSTNLLNAFKNSWCTTAGCAATPSVGDWDGERLFLAARLINEMEYQHLIFGEFARKVSPLIGAFVGYNETMDPSITAEFAHAVYRFGHSQLVDVVARNDAAGNPIDIDLLTAFTNPLAFNSDTSPATGQIATADQMKFNASTAAGNVFRGMTNQTGNEIDEFITGDLRNSLLGQPLDLATLNLVRGRDAGIPPLNTVRAYFYQATANSKNSTVKSLSAGLKPYSNWIEFAHSLRHLESLVNFVAAYGNFNGTVAGNPVVLDPNDFGTDADPVDFSVKRDAATAIVQCWLADQTNTALDCVNFMSGSATTTGVNDIDLWIGGLAENNTRLGSMLGSTFDYVFKTQLENLQESDRFYYLNRLAGTNLIAQVETNFWSQIVMRNTDVASLPADAFSVPSRTFNLPANSADNAAFLSANQPGLVFDASGAPMSKWIYTGTDHVTWNGTDGNDWIMAGSGDDSLYGGLGNDYLSGGKGDDFIMGGEGNDVIEDPESSISNILIGGPGDDYLAGGKGLNAYNGNDGNDFIVYGDTGGAALAGLGNDWIRGSAISDAISGDEGDDWMEGVSGSGDGLVGDPVGGLGVVAAGTVAGWDVMLASPGGGTFTGVEGGDIVKGESGGDVLLGGNGFDWLTSFNTTETSGTFEDMSNNAINCGVGQVCLLADQFTDVEGISGGEYDDELLGTSVTALQVGAVAAAPGIPAAVAINNQLVAKDCQLITGLQTLLNQTIPAGGVNNCAWNAGDIMIGGAGSDVITGRNGNDLIDGNSFLEVWIKIPSSWLIASDPKAPTPPANFAYVNDMAQVQSYILAHNQDAGPSPISQMSIYRGIRTAPHVAGENDIAVFQAPQANYTITKLPSGAIRVVDPRGGGAATNDGTDVLVNIETMRFPTVAGGTVFNDVSVASLPAAAPTIVSVSSVVNGLIVNFNNPAIDANVNLKGFQVRVWRGATRSTPAAPVTPVATQNLILPSVVPGPITASSLGLQTVTVTGLPAATNYFVDVVAITQNPAAVPVADIFGNQPANANAAPAVTAATTLTLTQPAQATGVYSGALLSPQPVVTITNSAVPPVVAVANNSTVVTATLWNSSNNALAPAGESISAGATATAVAGVATFTGMIITGLPNTTYTIRYTAPGVTVGSPVLVLATQSVTVASLPASKLALTTVGAGSTSGVALTTPPVIQIQNSNSQVVPTTGTVNAVLYDQGTTTPATAATITAGASASMSGGNATFTGMTITGTPGVYTIEYSTGGFTLTQDITVTAAPTATKLVINRSASGSVDGLALTTQPIIWATNNAGLAGFTGFNSSIDATLYDQGTSTPATGASITNGSATAVNGVATFSGLTITGTPGTYTIEYSSGGLTVATQLITVASAASTTTLIKTISAVAGVGTVPFTTQPVITLRSNGLAFTGTDGTVTATIGGGLGTAVLSGSTVTSVGGVATFTNLAVASLTAPGTYTITYTFATGETTSQTVTLSNNVTTGTVTVLAAVGVSGNGLFSPQPQVTLSTNSGAFTGTDGNVVATISSGATLSGTTSVRSNAGVANFTNLSVGNVIVSGNYTISFTFNGSVIATQNIALVSTNPTNNVLTIIATPGASAGKIAVTFTGIQGVTSYVVAAYSSATSTQIIRSTTVTVTAGAPSYSAVIANLSPAIGTNYYIGVVPSGSNQTYTRVVGTTP